MIPLTQYKKHHDPFDFMVFGDFLLLTETYHGRGWQFAETNWIHIGGY